MWVDISAYTQEYGPKTMGEGVVTPYSIPRLSFYTKKNTVLVHELASHIVTFVRRTCLQVITPSLQHFPVPYYRKTIVHVIQIFDGLGNNEGKFDFEAIKAQLSRLQLVGQTISFKFTRTDFQQCLSCAIAFAASKKTRSSTIDGSQNTVATPYISSEELHLWLSKLKAELPLLHPTGVSERELPVFLYDLSGPEMLLLDHMSQAHGFPDMVIAVQAPVGNIELDYSCGGDAVSFDASNAARPVLAALLQGGWGVAATHQSWDPVGNRTATEWLWSPGPTVFGYFSDEIQISFPLRDAAKRSVLYSVVNDSIAEVHGFISKFSRYGKELDEVLSASHHTEFLRRWNVYTYKLDKAALYISLHNHEHAMYYLLSLQHEIQALRDIIRIGGRGLHTKMACKKIYANKKQDNSRVWYVVWLCILGICWWIFSRRTAGGPVLIRERVKRDQ